MEKEEEERENRENEIKKRAEEWEKEKEELTAKAVERVAEVKNNKINNMTGIKNIILFGKMQSGKSTLANVLTNSNEFVENDYDRNRGIKFSEFELGEEKYRVIKTTAGLDEAGMDDKIVLSKLNEIVPFIEEDGLNQIFFVTRNSFDRRAVEIYDLLASVIFAPEVLDYITIVTTRYPSFDDENACQKEIENLLNESKDLNRIFSRAKTIFVDNPPIAAGRSAEIYKETREDSREVLIAHLNSIVHQNYRPTNLSTLNERINNYVNEEERKERIRKAKKKNTADSDNNDTAPFLNNNKPSSKKILSVIVVILVVVASGIIFLEIKSNRPKKEIN